MNKQEIFEKVSNHLFNQGKQAVTPGDSCKYRGGNYDTELNFIPDGTSCAVGCLIPDEIYRRDMEGKALKQLIDSFDYILPKYITSKSNRGLLTALQCVHDNPNSFSSSSSMRYALYLVGLAIELDVEFIQNLYFENGH